MKIPDRVVKAKEAIIMYDIRLNKIDTQMKLLQLEKEFVIRKISNRKKYINKLINEQHQNNII